MAIVRDKDKEESPEEAASQDEQPTEETSLAKADESPHPDAAEPDEAAEEAEPKDEAPVAAPMQLGSRRFVYAAYFAGAIAVAFLGSKVIDQVWFRLNQWKPTTFGEPQGEYVIVASAVLGIVAAIYYWRRGRTRRLAEEVANELSKVTWPGRTEVVNSTFITIVTTLVATVFFALMDRFWGFVTNLVYGT